MAIIKTKRTCLRPFRMEDAEAVYDYARRDEVGPMAGWQPHLSIEETNTIVASFVENDEVFAITWENSDYVIGSVGIHRRHPDIFNKTPGEREIGYVLHPDYWGQGIMPEVVQAIIDYAFMELDVPLLWCGHFEGNTKSKSVIEKSGFAFAMVQKKWHHGKNAIITLYSYCMSNPNLSEDEILEQTLELLGNEGVHSAYTYLQQMGTKRRHWSANGYNFLYCLAAADGKETEALEWMRQAIEIQDYWYRPEVFEDEDLERLFGHPQFEALKEVSIERYNRYVQTAEYLLKTEDKGEDRLLMVLHGNQQNNEHSETYWSTLNESLNMAYLQSKTPDVKHQYRWDENGNGPHELARQLALIHEHSYRAVYLGGFSAGCQVILRSLVEEKVVVNGIFLVAPWIPVVDDEQEAIVRYMKTHDISIAIYWGELDEDCKEGAKAFYEACSKAGVDVSGGEIPGIGHVYPKRFNDYIDRVIRKWCPRKPFDILVGEQEVKANYKVNRREAVRGVINDGKRLLMVHNVGGDFKFPGGGIEEGESHREALLREIAEETGYSDAIVEDYMGHACSRYIDQQDASAYFEMDSYYYRVQLTGRKQEQNLDDYEQALEFVPVCCPIDDAIRINKEVLDGGSAHQWVEREIKVLEELRKMCF